MGIYYDSVVHEPWRAQPAASHIMVIVSLQLSFTTGPHPSVHCECDHVKENCTGRCILPDVPTPPCGHSVRVAYETWATHGCELANSNSLRNVFHLCKQHRSGIGVYVCMAVGEKFADMWKIHHNWMRSGQVQKQEHIMNSLCVLLLDLT